MKKLQMFLAVAVVMSVASVSMCAADTLGMVVDNSTKKAVVFDADTDTVLGAVSVTPGSANGACSITPDQKLGFATNFASSVSVIDLATIGLASGTNPIPISNAGEDTSISADGKWLVVSDGSALQPISVVNIAARAQVSTFSLPSDANSVEVCSNGSVLVTSSNTGNVYRLAVNTSTGVLTNAGDVLFSGGIGEGGPNNASCAPAGQSGVVVRRLPHEIRSFAIPGLALVNTRTLSGDFGLSVAINETGDRIFVRSNLLGGGRVDGYTYNSTTGALGASPAVSFAIPAGAPTFYGMDQMAIHPNGAKLYVPQPGSLNVYNSITGALIKSITNANIVSPAGVCLGLGSCAAPAISTVSAMPNVLWPPDHKMVEVAINYTETGNCPATCVLTVASNELTNGTGDGNTSPDWQVIDAHHLLLRAERAGNDNDRIYTITITCTNDTNKTATKTVTVTIPHDQGK